MPGPIPGGRRAGPNDDTKGDPMAKLLIPAGLLALLLLVQGCAVLASSPYHKPSSSEAGVGEAGLGGMLFVRFGGNNKLTITRPEAAIGVRSIGTGIYVPKAMGPLLPVIPTFMSFPDEPYHMVDLEIRLQPLADNVTFDPMAVRLTNSLGIEFTPLGYIDSHNRSFMFYSPRQSSQESRAIPIPPGGKACFVLEFELESSPDWNLTLDVRGVKSGDGDLSPPRFQLERGPALYLIWGGRELFCAE